MLSFYAASFLSRPVLYKNGTLAGVCKEVAFSSRLSKMTGLIVYDRDGKRLFLAARHIASQGYDAIILKTGAVLTDPTGNFPLGRLAYRFDGKPLSRIEDAALDEKRNVLFFTLASGESYPASAVVKSADPTVVFGQTDAPISPKRQYVRKKSAQAEDLKTAPMEEKEAPSDEAERQTSTGCEVPENTAAKPETAPKEEPSNRTSAATPAALAETLPTAAEAETLPTTAEAETPAIASAMAERSPAATPAAETAPITSAAETLPTTAAAETRHATGALQERQTANMDSAAKAQISIDAAAKNAVFRRAAPVLYTLPGAGFALPERVADGRNLLGRIMKSDLFTRGGTIILRAGERVTPAAVAAAARAGLTVDLVRKSRPALF